MKRQTFVAAVMLALALVPCLVPALAVAGSASEPVSDVASPDPSGASAGLGASAPRSDGAASDSWRGAVGAILCGVFVKLTIASGGSSVGTIAAAVAACTFMVFDAMTSNP